MKIHDSNLNSVSTTTQQTGQASALEAASRSASGTKASTSGDAVQLSDLSEALSSLTMGGPAHAARIAQLAAIYQGGSYKADAHSVSRSLVQDALSAA
jgi:flagellar biosynthesis anti-sigma factor FlgM